MQFEKCPKCNGKGRIASNKSTGEQIRGIRQRMGFTLTAAAKLMGISKAHLSDLELGQRAWRPELITRFKKAMVK